MIYPRWNTNCGSQLHHPPDRQNAVYGKRGVQRNGKGIAGG